MCECVHIGNIGLSNHLIFVHTVRTNPLIISIHVWLEKRQRNWIYSYYIIRSSLFQFGRLPSAFTRNMNANAARITAASSWRSPPWSVCMACRAVNMVFKLSWRFCRPNMKEITANDRHLVIVFLFNLHSWSHSSLAVVMPWAKLEWLVGM